VHPARDLRRHDLQRAQGLEKIGHLCDYVLWDEAWIGYNAFHPLFDDHSPMRMQQLGPRCRAVLHAVGAQAGRRLLAGLADPQARRAHPRPAALRRAQALQRVVPDDASTSPFYPLFASLDVNAKIHEGKAGEMLWDRCIELGIEARKKLREFGRYYARPAQTPGEMVLRSVRARRGDDPDSQFTAD
jgi:ornithine decarboxylase